MCMSTFNPHPGKWANSAVLKVSCGCLCLFYLQHVGKYVSDSCYKVRPSLVHVNARPLISWIGSHFTQAVFIGSCSVSGSLI